MSDSRNFTNPSFVLPDFPRVVTTLADTGPGSLRNAIGYGGNITFAPNLSGQTISLTTPLVVYLRDVNIDTSAVAGGITLQFNPLYGVPALTPIFAVTPGKLLAQNDALKKRTTVTGGSAFWTGVAKDGQSALKSGAIANSQQSNYEITVTGPGTLNFSWMTASETPFKPPYAQLRFLVDGADAATPIFGETPWQPQTVSIPAGTHTLLWTYSKDANTPAGPDAGWLRQVAFAAIPVPDPPTALIASAGVVGGQALVVFTPPVNVGGSAITGYTVTASPAGGVDSNANSVTTAHIITGLANGTAYTFTAKATNSFGVSGPSVASASVTPSTVPGAPIALTATAGNALATVSFTAPAFNGGRVITGYAVTSSPAGGVDSNTGTTGTSHVVTGLVNGTAYTFTVRATNGSGTGAPSAASASVTPLASLTGPVPVTAVEFYHAAFDHYYFTWVADEIVKLDNGTFTGWARTGLSFKAFSTVQSGTSAVCRIYIPPGKGDGHFFGRDTNECVGTMTKHPDFILESSTFVYLYPPTFGNCAAGTVPVYRVFSNRADANHRYTTSRAVRDQMVTKGWLAEGDGADIVVMCAPQ